MDLNAAIRDAVGPNRNAVTMPSEHRLLLELVVRNVDEAADRVTDTVQAWLATQSADRWMAEVTDMTVRRFQVTANGGTTSFRVECEVTVTWM